jgi:hypothetical protein
MANVTFSIPDELYHYMKQHKEIRWSVIVHDSVRKYLEKLDRNDDFFDKYAVKKLFEDGDEANELFKI